MLFLLILFIVDIANRCFCLGVGCISCCLGFGVIMMVVRNYV